MSDIKNSLLVKNLEKFSSKEQLQLKDFANSPIFNKSQALIDLLHYLLKTLKKAAQPTKEEAFRCLFGTAVFNDHKVRLLMSDLLKLVEDFIVYQQSKKTALSREILLSTYYRKADMEKHFDRTHRKAKRQLPLFPYRNQEYFSLQNKLQWEQYEVLSSKKRDIAMNLQELGQSFDIFYFSARLRQACFLKAQQTFSDISYDFSWIDQLLLYIEQKEWLSIPAISLYYYAYQLYVDIEAPANFEALKQQILEYSPLFPPEEIRDIYVLTLNYCIRKVNAGQRAYLKESLDLYKAGLASGCFLENGVLSKFTFSNIVAMGLMVKDFEWVATFIQDYKNSLKKQDRQSAFCLNMARLEYTSKRNYDEALTYLQKVSDKDLLNTLNAKILQLRIYFEIAAYDLLESHLEAMSNFIRRKSVMGYHKENFLHLIRYTKKLLKLNLFDKKAITQLATAIQAEEVLTEKAWLLEQIKKLKEG